MTGHDLKMARGKLVGNGRGAVKTMANKLETPYRTYQGWEARRGQIPGVTNVAVTALVSLSTKLIDTPIDPLFHKTKPG